MRVETDITRNNDGIIERIVIEIHDAKYPYPRRIKRVYGEATNVAKRFSRAYNSIRRSLGDDWVSDITDSWYMPESGLTEKQKNKINDILESA